jgi:hypothetical protein
MSWEASNKKGTFFSLHLTIKGAAGTGNSFIINTIVIYLRRIFDDNDMVHVVASTGMAAFNVLGETLHRFSGLDWKNMKNKMTKRTQEQLQKKLQNTIAIMMDDGSMISQIILVLAEKAVCKNSI